MSSTSLPVPIYSERHPAPFVGHWLTYATVPLADLGTLLLVGILSAVVQHAFSSQPVATLSLSYLPCIPIFCAVFAIAGLYPGCPVNPIEEFRIALRAVGLSFLLIVMGSFLLGGVQLSRMVLLCAWLLTSVLIPLDRHFVRRWCSGRHWWGIPTVILGEREVGTKILKLLLSDRSFGLKPVAILFDRLPDGSPTAIMDNVFVGDLSHSSLLAQKYRKCYAILATPLTGSQGVKKLVAEHADEYRRVLVIPDLFGITSLAVKAKEIHGILGLEIDHNLTKILSQLSKRFFDVVLSLIVALSLTPIFLLIASMIYISSPGPIFYWQRRIGRGGRTFRLWKFRTMVTDADAVLENHLQSNALLHAEWNLTHKLRNDPRTTPIGRMLRRTSMDELPQLWNVLRGEMSLVGPRPIRQPEVEKYGTIFDQYQRVSPGLTGMWQINGRNNTTYEKRTQLDEYYVRNWSLSLDFYILLRTLKTILLTEGAY